MTPQEKATELVEKFKPYVNGYVGSSMLTNTEYPESILSKAKECARIVVNEMIDRLTWHTDASDLGNTIIAGDIEYWYEVSQSIKYNQNK